ncbi:hypothetical protein ACJRO7_009968 [Eucalyptus globulus]|uniref:non-specific serine/threonine protein kinase n=1 Tax=Eucalyptus globulus TaxID=34317 RepID=A0ABD3LE08_EUCGL
MDLTTPFSSLSLLFFISLQIHFPVRASGYFSPFQECAPFVCGYIRISYPFRHIRQPRYCGYPGYELDCDGFNPILYMVSQKYQVIHMDRSVQILVVARSDLSDSICLETYNETTLDLNLFNYTSNNLNSTLIYNCNSWPTLPSYYRFSCPESHFGYFILCVNLSNLLPKRCSSIVHVPISKSEPIGLPPASAGIDFGDNISDILNKGFEITWIANTSLCEDCAISGGICGYDWTRKEFNCFCRDAAYPATCHRTPIPTSVPSMPPVPAIIPSSMYAYSHLTCGF